MAIVFYYAPMTSAARVHLALEELGVPFEKVRVDLAAGEQRRPEFLKVNPNGKVPAMIVDGRPLFESLAMLLYLGEAYGVERGLFPAPGLERLEAFKWMAWGSVSLAEAAMRFMRNTSDRWPAEQRSAAAAEAARKDLDDLLRLLDAHLGARPFLLGADYSLADCAVVTLVAFLGRIGIERATAGNVGGWAERCLGRPAFARMMAG